MLPPLRGNDPPRTPRNPRSPAPRPASRSSPESSPGGVRRATAVLPKVVRYRRERMSMDRESSAQAEPIRLPLASSFLHPLSCGLRRGRATTSLVSGSIPAGQTRFVDTRPVQRTCAVKAHPNPFPRVNPCISNSVRIKSHPQVKRSAPRNTSPPPAHAKNPGIHESADRLSLKPILGVLLLVVFDSWRAI